MNIQSENEINKIVEDIQQIVFQCDVYSNKRSEIHKKVQNYLMGYFFEKGFKITPEYKIKYRKLGRIKRLQGQVQESKIGYIDVFIQRNNLKIAIEFDSGASMKYKSLEKLLQSGANMCIAIAYGPKKESIREGKYYLQKNFSRLNQVYDELCQHYRETNNIFGFHELINKDFWLGIVKMDTFKHITFIPKESV